MLHAVLLARIDRGWNWGFDHVVGGYRALLQFNERHRWAVIDGHDLPSDALFANGLWEHS